MCRALVWARRDNVTGFARGEVVEIRDDENFHWGNAVMGPNALGAWRCIEITGVPMRALISLQLNDASGGRTCRFDLDALEAAEGRLDHWDIIVINYEQAIAAIRLKPVVANAVFGEPEKVFG